MEAGSRLECGRILESDKNGTVREFWNTAGYQNSIELYGHKKYDRILEEYSGMRHRKRNRK